MPTSRLYVQRDTLKDEIKLHITYLNTFVVRATASKNMKMENSLHPLDDPENKSVQGYS
jgi:hypothetical protein